jgi:hypothetical protein
MRVFTFLTAIRAHTHTHTQTHTMIRLTHSTNCCSSLYLTHAYILHINMYIYRFSLLCSTQAFPTEDDPRQLCYIGEAWPTPSTRIQQLFQKHFIQRHTTFKNGYHSPRDPNQGHQVLILRPQTTHSLSHCTHHSRSIISRGVS